MRVHTETAWSGLSARLAEIGRDLAGTGARPSPTGSPEVLYDRHDVLVVRVGDVVVKAHQPDREYGVPFLGRTRVAGSLPHLVVGPLAPPMDVDGRTVTVSPYGEPVDPQEELPWEEGARLLAALHSTPVPADAPSWGRPTRVARLVSRLADGPAPDAVRRAFATLPAWIRGEAPEPPPGRDERLIHGDWHLGQMVRLPAPRNGDLRNDELRNDDLQKDDDGYRRWRLIDIEDLGTGAPAWDLARPAALFSAGVLDPGEWGRFLGAYRQAGGPAVPADGDPWAALDVPARSLAIQIAATCVISAGRDDRPLDGAEQAMVDACARISTAGTPA